MESVRDMVELDRGRWLLGLGHGWARRLVRGRLERIGSGLLRIQEKGAAQTYGRRAEDGLAATIEVLDARLWTRLVWRGSVGAAESFMAGEWRSDDLTSVVRILARNRHAMDQIEGGWAMLAALGERLGHLRRRNSRTGSRRNIEAHYDLSNEFFELFLDREMLYSCGRFDRPGMSLDEAQQAKLDRLAALLELRNGDEVLEIGTGWGAMALHAAGAHGCRVTTTTISPAQHAYARARVAAAGLDDRIEVLDRDYRELEGRFDKLVSIEMIEAVGAAYLDRFFALCADRLRPGGRMALQAITIADTLYEEALRSVDFIQRYIFPGGFIPSVSALVDSAARAGLVATRLEDIGPSYAQTLRAWRHRFHAARDEVRAMGFSPRFERLWTYYFCYCEGGFLERTVSDVQVVFEKPAWAPERAAS